MKLKGVIKFTGRLGEIKVSKQTNRRGQAEYIGSTLGGVERERIQNDPNFQRTRENNAEFGRAATAGKLLREAAALSIREVRYRTLAGDLTKQFRSIISADDTNPRGERRLISNAIPNLKGYQVGVTPIDGIMTQNFTIDDSAADYAGAPGQGATITANVTPVFDFTPLQGATHVRLFAQAVVTATPWDLENETYPGMPRKITGTIAEQTFPITDNTATPVSLVPTIDASTLPGTYAAVGYTLFGVMYMQDVNGTMYELNDKSRNALIVADAQYFSA